MEGSLDMDNETIAATLSAALDAGYETTIPQSALKESQAADCRL